jgi:hypothetical protein
MMNDHHSNANAVVGTAVTIASGAYSFFGTTLVVVQWFAAATACTVGILTAVHLLKHWGKPK